MSPKPPKNYISNPQLTPVLEEAKVIGNSSFPSSPEYEDCVPIVDKAVDSGCKTSPTSSASKGASMLLDLSENSKGVRAHVVTWLATFIMTLFALLRSITCHVTKHLPDKNFELDHYYPDFELDPMPKEEFRPPSPSPGYTEANLLSSIVKRLGELEEKVDTLKGRPSEMPYEKEELLNAAVCRVDALEAELISTKKALHEALMRQEELLAYIDQQKEAKFRKKKFCI